MSSKPAKRKRPRFKRTVTADSLTAAVETVVLDALINASGMRGEHFDIHHHEGKWSAIAKHDGTHIAEVVAQVEEQLANQFTITCDSHAINPLDGQLDDVRKV